MAFSVLYLCCLLLVVVGQTQGYDGAFEQRKIVAAEVRTQTPIPRLMLNALTCHIPTLRPFNVPSFPLLLTLGCSLLWKNCERLQILGCMIA